MRELQKLIDHKVEKPPKRKSTWHPKMGLKEHTSRL